VVHPRRGEEERGLEGGLTLLGAIACGVLAVRAGLPVHMLISPEVLANVPAQPWMRPNGFALREGTEWLRLWLAVVGWGLG